MSRPSPATARTIAVLNLFIEHPRQSFTLTDVIKALKLSRATCHALLGTLVEARYLYRMPDKSFVIGPALVAAGRIARENYSPLDVVRVEMRSLADRFDAICVALFREKYELVLRERAGGMSHLGWLPPAGQRVDMATPWGGLVLAWDEDAVILDWLGRIAVDPESAEGERILAAMHAARERGYFFSVLREGWAAEVANAPIEERRQHTDYFIADVDDARSYALSFMIAPVRSSSGNSAFLAVSSLRHEVTGAQIREIGAALIEACGRVSDFQVRSEGR